MMTQFPIVCSFSFLKHFFVCWFPPSPSLNPLSIDSSSKKMYLKYAVFHLNRTTKKSFSKVKSKGRKKSKQTENDMAVKMQLLSLRQSMQCKRSKFHSTKKGRQKKQEHSTIFFRVEVAGEFTFLFFCARIPI